METPSPEAAERETRIRRLSVLHSPMLQQEHVSLSLWMAPLRSTMESVVWSLLRPSSVLVGPVLVEDCCSVLVMVVVPVSWLKLAQIST